MSEIVDPQPDDELLFAAHDLGPVRPGNPALSADEHRFVLAPRTAAEHDSGDAQAGAFVAGGRDAAPAAPPPPADPSAPAEELDDRAPAAQPPAELTAEAVQPQVRSSFRLSSGAGVPTPSQHAELPWLLREPVKEPARSVARRGWAMRHSDRTDGSLHAAMLRLREEAVDVSWQAAWIAVSSADPRLHHKRPV